MCHVFIELIGPWVTPQTHWKHSPSIFNYYRNVITGLTHCIKIWCTWRCYGNFRLCSFPWQQILWRRDQQAYLKFIRNCLQITTTLWFWKWPHIPLWSTKPASPTYMSTAVTFQQLMSFDLNDDKLLTVFTNYDRHRLIPCLYDHLKDETLTNIKKIQLTFSLVAKRRRSPIQWMWRKLANLESVVLGNGTALVGRCNH